MSRDEDIEIMARAIEKAFWADSSSDDIAEAALTALEASGRTVVQGWQPIESAPKDGTVIWAVLRADLYPKLHPARDDLKRWNGLQAPLRHPGVAEDGFDIGWNIALPVGHGGFPDEWIAGWQALPSPPMKGQKG